MSMRMCVIFSRQSYLKIVPKRSELFLGVLKFTFIRSFIFRLEWYGIGRVGTNMNFLEIKILMQKTKNKTKVNVMNDFFCRATLRKIC